MLTWDSQDTKDENDNYSNFYFDEIKLHYHFSYENFIPFRNLKTGIPNMTNKNVLYNQYRHMTQSTCKKIKDLIF